MKDLSEKDTATRERQKGPFVALLGLLCLLLFTAACVWMGIQSVKSFVTIFSTTAIQYSIPQDAVDEHIKILIRHFFTFGVSEFGAIFMVLWIWYRFRKLSTDIKGIRSRSEDSEKEDGTPD
jgi:hypothetical protein